MFVIGSQHEGVPSQCQLLCTYESLTVCSLYTGFAWARYLIAFFAATEPDMQVHPDVFIALDRKERYEFVAHTLYTELSQGVDFASFRTAAARYPSGVNVIEA